MGAFGCSFLGAAVPGAPHGQKEAARKVWPHSESGGPTSPHPRNKAIAYPPFWPFSAGRFWDGGVWAVVFWRSCARGIPRAKRGRSQSLAQSESGGPRWSTHPPRLQPTSRFGPFPLGGFGMGAFGRSFLGAAMPGASRGHTEAARNVWPHSESGGPTSPHYPTKAIAHPPFWPFSAGGFGMGAFGRSFLGAAVPGASRGHTEAARNVWPHSESGGPT